MKRNDRCWPRTSKQMLKTLGGLAAAFWLIAPGLAQAAEEKSPAIPRDSVAFGRTYSEWAAAWWQWALSIPPSAHPLFDTADCNTGQTGPVFFLGGKFNGGSAKRSCTVPAGKTLFFPVLNAEDSTLEEGPPDKASSECNPKNANPPPQPTITCLRQFAQDGIDPTIKLAVRIDGQSIPNLKTDFREQSVAFDFTLPSDTDNVFNAEGEGPFKAGTYSVGVDDGVYVMLAPLSPGLHMLHFTGTFPPSIVIDITYHLTVSN